MNRNIFDFESGPVQEDRRQTSNEFSAGKAVRVTIWAVFLACAALFLFLLFLAEMTNGRPMSGTSMVGMVILWMVCYAIGEMTK